MACFMATLCVLATSAHAASLYSGPGHRPGPDILYKRPTTAPQLTNSGLWKARPILVSGASAYRNGEFLYQDFLYDDHGAHDSRRDSNDERTGADLFSQPNGTYTYPTGAGYAGNAADLVEFRVRPLARWTAFRITLNTLIDPELVGFTIAIGNSKAPRPFPHGANTSAPAQRFLTVHGRTAELVDAASGKKASRQPRVAVDKRRRQFRVLVPHSAWNPGNSTVRFALGIGLWDREKGAYLIPQASADETHPGGAGGLSNPSAFFNVAFRPDEPMPEVTDLNEVFADQTWWRDRQQGHALADGDITPLRANVSFRKLHVRVRDDSAVPRTGPIDRIMSSRFDNGNGVDFANSCLSAAATCKGQFLGRLQPYAIYVPRKKRPARGYGMTLLLHSLSTNYNQYLDSNHQKQFGERGGGSIVVTPEARGVDGSYVNYAAVDVFEVWADVASRYRLDPAWTVTTGYSMGAIGSFTLAGQFPDLFSRIQPTVGFDSNNLAPSLRNIPVLMWNGAADELVGPELYRPTARALDELGYRYELDVFYPGEHNSLAYNDQYAPAAAFLGTARVDRNPAHVTYVIDPNLNRPKLGYVADHAYWISDLRLRDAGSRGRIDAVSRGAADPTPSATQMGAGTLTGGTIDPYPYTSEYKTWGAAPRGPYRNRIELTAENVSAATINPRRAGVGCDVDLHIDSDGPLTVKLAGCGRAARAG